MLTRGCIIHTMDINVYNITVETENKVEILLNPKAINK